MALSILTLAACGDSNNNPTPEPFCGDGIVTGGEACDDGNTNDNDECTNSCQLVSCGDGIVAVGEACDDGNTIDGDGCDNNCTETSCGNGIMTDGEACDDGNPTNGDGCDDNCRPSGCGNGAVGGTEMCDDGNAVDGDGCDINCTRTACGNGITAGHEQCDDGNGESGDGCTSTCQIETAEQEPNEDGSPETGGNSTTGGDFAIANADLNGAFTTSVTLTASLMPAGDEDVFKFTNPGAEPVRLRLEVWNLEAGFGIGTACGSSIDTVMNVRNAAGDVLAQDDDRIGTGPIDRCSSLAYPLLAGETVYVQVIDFGDVNAITSYALEARFETVVCGDGDVGPGEQCDDTNTATGDGCSDMCQIEGAVTEFEPNEDGSVALHGDLTGGNDFAIANADLNGAYTANATIFASLMPAGDEDVFKISNTSTMTMNVALDVWDLSRGQGVSCGIAGIDTVLDIRRADGTIVATNNDRSASDRCSGLVYPLAPGQTVYAQVFESFDDGLVPSYGFQIRFTPVVCGDSTVGAGEQCDDGNTTNGDGCDSMCQIEVVCGDGTLQPTEQCDDGNTMSGDGCSSMCKYEGGVTEVEPNEDGIPDLDGNASNGNDFAIANADANGAFTANTTIVASLMPAGDEDVFKISNTGAAPINVALDTWDLDLGIGMSCGTTGVDTVLNVRNAAGMVLRTNNDRVTGSDFCAALRYPLLPGETIYAQVLDWADNSQVLSYALQIQFLPSVCGNGVFEAGEQCDDGNTMNADGCSSTCQIEGAISEVEPNEDGSPAPGGNASAGNDFSIANADTHAPITGTATVIASLMPVGDEDVFKITNTGATGVNVALDTWDLSLGVGVSCGTTGIDTVLNIRNAGGTVLATNNNRVNGSDACAGGLTYPLSPGESIYAQVIDFQDNGLVAGYILRVKFTPEVCGNSVVGPGEQCDDGGTTPGDGCSALCQIESICGDGVVQPGEQCDDNDTTAGDGCSAICQLEGAVAETEPNDDGTPSTGGSTTNGNDFSAATAGGPYTSSTVITGSINPLGDEDVYAITNPGATPAIVNLDVWNLGYQFGIGKPCGTSIDTGLNIRDSSGALLASNDDRNSSLDRCSSLTYTLAPSTTVYAHLVEFGDNAVIPTYALVVNIAPTVCGDGTVGPGEQCDDGNTTSGDGCSSTCQAVVEIEPNDTTAAAMASTLQVSSDATIAGAIGAAGDKDVFAVTVTTPTVIRFETFTSAGDCATTAALDMRLLDSAGAPIVADLAGQGIRNCGAITMPLAAGSYYIQIEERGNDAAVPAYLLEIAFQDDVGTETEPNGTEATASVNLFGENESYVFGDHMLNADVDVYAVIVPAGMRIRAEVIEGDRATATCESNLIDSSLSLYDQNGLELANDADDGRGLCSLVDGTGSAAIDRTARNGTQATQMYYLKVASTSMAASGQFVYRLQVTVRP